MAGKGEMPYCYYPLSLLQNNLNLPVKGAAVPDSVCTGIVRAAVLSVFPVLPCFLKNRSYATSGTIMW